ncbi:MAG: BON domain-containing protein [Candidatus Sumerlaeota bacterium]
MKNMRRITMKVLAATLLLVLAGGFAAAQDNMSDLEITNAVDDELIGDQAVPATKIDVMTTDGIVTLDGIVNNILAKDRAEKLALRIKGVRGVINGIDVMAPLRDDEDIKENVLDALLWDPVTELWELTATVDDGKVTLEGTVDSRQEKQLAEKVVKGVRGVRAVDNQLIVEYDTERPDSEIREEVKQALRWDVYVDDTLIDVTVDDSKVTLEGTVGSAAEKREATREAWVAGVSNVDNQLDVKYWARDEKLRKDKYVEMSDEQVEEAVRDALLYDPRVLSFDIQVEADAGYVTLRGKVDNFKAKRAAANDARNVVGVWGIKNQIKVRPSTTPSDSKIEQRVENALLNDPYVALYEVDVTVIDGEVFLYGTVDSAFEKAQADDVAASVRGVLDVNNYLVVRDEAFTGYDPYSDEWYPYDYRWYSDLTPTTAKSDWQLRRDIADLLYWSPYVDRDKIEIQVDDGIVTLEGEVETWTERLEAREKALNAGAVVVNNNIEVEYGPDFNTD